MPETARSASSRLEPRLFVAALVLAAFAFQGTRGLWETDEGRYAECARAMTASGEWLLPRLQGLPHLTKPPGAYWFIAAGIEILGRNEWGARLFLGIAFAVGAWCVRVIGRGLLGDAAGARAGWCYLTMLYPFAAGNVITTDTFLAATVLGSIACIVASFRAARPGWWHAGAAVCLAAAMFVKGHAALLPWAAFVIGCDLARRTLCATRAPLTAGQTIRAYALFAAALAAGTAWYVWAAVHVPGAYEHFTGHELKGRFVSAGDHSPKSWWYYLLVILAASLPWWAGIVRGMRRLAFAGPGRVLVAWGGITFLVFELLPGKMFLYLLPCAAPLALWAAVGAKDEMSPWPIRPRMLAAWGVVLLTLKVGLGFHADPRDMRTLAGAVRGAGASEASPAVLLSGKDLHGLDFYLDGAVRRVTTIEVSTTRSDVTLERAVAARAVVGEPWILVIEDDPPEWTAVRRVLGDQFEVAARPKSYAVLRITPRRR
ncbi:MAG: glycosyltransferase family 39 protein [Planctomycetes bacterium]|nr:glycosyltransferase family 39 protein [Planctomycetota bacterium]